MVVDKTRVIIVNRQKEIKIPTGIRMLIRRCCNAVLKLEKFKGSAEVSVTIVDNAYIQSLNKQYRNKDVPTDVLSFPQFEDMSMLPEEGEICLGDVVICPEKARLQAEEYGHSQMREMVYLFVHSILHLLGYDHMEADEKAVMRQKEEEAMKEIDLGR